ncbi:MAG: hypothetical protein JXA21_04895 [Anaerolineae bacterium]|nr:hypothetical protein [Anaerolineae bacterium]
MPTKRRQQKRAKHEAKRKAKRKAIQQHAAATGGKRGMLLEALKWPLLECWVNEDWQDPTILNQVVVARRDPLTDEVRAGIYLVDRACLGVKNAYAANFATPTEFRERLLAEMKERQSLIQVDINFAAAIVKAGLDYAATLEFQPHKDYRLAAILLQDADPAAVKEEIPVGGPEGKPFFVAGPYDHVDAITAKLIRKVGVGNFSFMTPMSKAPEGFNFGEDWEDDEDFDGLFDDDVDENIIEGDDIDWLLEDADEDE